MIEYRHNEQINIHLTSLYSTSNSDVHSGELLVNLSIHVHHDTCIRDNYGKIRLCTCVCVFVERRLVTVSQNAE